jgi:hypothetical protein
MQNVLQLNERASMKMKPAFGIIQTPMLAGAMMVAMGSGHATWFGAGVSWRRTA